MSRCRFRIRERGYTLVEVLVAVSVFALLAGSAYVALDGLSRSAEAHRDRAEAFGEIQQAVARLDGDLRQLVSRPVRGEGGRLQAALQGERNSLEATRAGWLNPSGQRRSDLQRFAWQLNDGGLERFHWPVTDRTAAVQPASRFRLDGVSGFELRYLGRDGRWLDNWPESTDRTASLPAAVEVLIETEGFGRLRRLVVVQ